MQQRRAAQTDLISNQLFTNIFDPVGTQPEQLKQEIMISPPYTPFAEHEVRYALGLTKDEYIEAVRTGVLSRSVHFECRVSPTTALHNLVDVVRFDVISGRSLEQAQQPGFTEQCDHWLDELCCLDEDREVLGRAALIGDVQEVMRLVLPGDTAPLNYEAPKTWQGELVVLAIVIVSWCRCYRALNEMLIADDLRHGAHQIERSCWSVQFQSEPSQRRSFTRSAAAL